MSFAEYLAIQRTSATLLKELRRSPAHYHHRQTHPRPDNDHLGLGRAVHVAVLEPDQFDARYLRWSAGRRYGKSWDAFEAEAERMGREPIKSEDADRCLAMAAAVEADPAAWRYLERGTPEAAILWTDRETGIECKGRVDWIAGPARERTALVDLKTTRDAAPVAFGRQAWALGYPLQAAFYVDGYAASHRELVLPFVVIAVEVEPPHVVQVYRVPDEVLELGREEYRELLDVLARCQREKHWPGYADGELDLQLPRWAVRDEDEDVSGLGLVFEPESEPKEAA